MKKFVLIIFILFGVGIFSLFFHLRFSTVNNLITSISSGRNLTSSLGEVVTQSLQGAKGDYGIVVKNLKSGESFMINEHKSYQPGSLYKLWVMAETFNQMELGILKEDQILSQDIKILNSKFDISSDSAELNEGEISLSVSDAIKQMIQISHNYAALLLSEKIKLSNIAKFLQKNGFKESMVGIDGSDLISTPYDIAQFFEKLYKGQLANSTNTNKMLGLLKNQQLNGKLPKYLPEHTTIAHKTGEIDDYSHDAGIIYLPSDDYIIVVLSKSDYPPGAEDKIAQVAKAVYEYFKK